MSRRGDENHGCSSTVEGDIWLEPRTPRREVE